MTEPRIAGRSPLPPELEPGKSYYWRACGRSGNQPFCDGSHAGTEFSPLEFRVDQAGKHFLCACKRARTPPFCDGSHRELGEPDMQAQNGPTTVWYKVAEPQDMRNGEVRAVQAGPVAIALTRFQDHCGALDNACPHQGGPLGEGSVECADESGECWLRCPWHGWDFHPLTGRSPGAHDDGVATYPVEERDDGVYPIFVSLKLQIHVFQKVTPCQN